MINKKKNVGVFIFDQVEILDFAGPYEVFTSTRLVKKSTANIHNIPCPFNVFTISEKKKNIITTGNLSIKSDYSFSNFPYVDILIIPGGIGTRSLLKNRKVLKWIKNFDEKSTIASVCTGALLLAKAGLLLNRKATTHWGALNLLKNISPTTTIIENKKFVFDKYYSSSGVSAGINMTLHIIQKFCGKIIAKNTSKYIEFDN
tara:strand:- start:340 stop:945 length:606 start_codon:yes stop_codon:yes gene_type:complete